MSDMNERFWEKNTRGLIYTYMGKWFSICLQKETREIQVKELPNFEDVRP